MSNIYVPRDGMRIIMPGNQPDWPTDGQAVNQADPYQRRLVKDGDLVPKPHQAAAIKAK